MDLLADLMEMEGGVPDLGALNGLPADVLHVIQGHLQECAILLLARVLLDHCWCGQL